MLIYCFASWKFLQLQDSSKLKVLTDSLVLPAQMAVAAVAHLYVFPAKPYELLADQPPGNVSVLGDYASADCPIDPDEVRDSTRPTKLRLPQPDVSAKSVTDIRESVRDIVVGGGEHVSPSHLSLFICFAIRKIHIMAI